jgi:hypothetical protein
MSKVYRVVLIRVTVQRLKPTEQCLPNFTFSYPFAGEKRDLKASKQETELKLCHRNSVSNCHLGKSSSGKSDDGVFKQGNESSGDINVISAVSVDFLRKIVHGETG